MDISQRLTEELDQTMARLRQGDVMRDEWLYAAVEPLCAADTMDEIQLTIDRDMDFATRSLLLLRARRLSTALDRVRRGIHGICDECGELIAPARLAALPEVTTCVRCQDHLERAERLYGERDFLGDRFGGHEEDL